MIGPTQSVNQWLNSSEALIQQTRNNVEYIQELAQDPSINAQAALAEQLEEWVTEMATISLIDYDLTTVDWYEIATAWLSEAQA